MEPVTHIKLHEDLAPSDHLWGGDMVPGVLGFLIDRSFIYIHSVFFSEMERFRIQ